MRKSPPPGTASPAGGYWSRFAWLVLWGSFASLILQPAVLAPRGLHDAIAGTWQVSPAGSARSTATLPPLSDRTARLPCLRRACLFLSSDGGRDADLADQDRGGHVSGQAQRRPAHLIEQYVRMAGHSPLRLPPGSIPATARLGSASWRVICRVLDRTVRSGRQARPLEPGRGDRAFGGCA